MLQKKIRSVWKNMYGTFIHGRRGGSCLGYPPPEKFWVEIPPHREGYSLAKYSPPSEKFFPHPKNSPPKIWKKWQFLWIPPLNFVNFLGSPPWRRWLFGSLDSPPKKFSKSLPPDGLRCSPMYDLPILIQSTHNEDWIINVITLSFGTKFAHEKIHAGKKTFKC